MNFRFSMLYLGLHLGVTRLKRADLQHLMDKIARKVRLRRLKIVNMVSGRVLIIVLFMSQDIYNISSIDLPKEVIKRIIAPPRA
jgi:hypothetical protein